jgi:class 3 adenylate cyclase/ketosteroid isomerase-like protein
VTRSARFCDTCGASLSGADAVAGRRTITVVFADLVESTALQERIDAEPARAVMARFYDAMRSVVAAHGGRVQKFIGDALVAVFGVPVVREDDALRAVRAAAAIGRSLEMLNNQLERVHGVRLAIRTGVHTGELVTGEHGNGDVLAESEILVGDVLNTAARLEQEAGAGEVLVSMDTRRLVRHAVELEPVGALELKGKAEPVRAWRLVSPDSPGTSSEMSIEPPLIGRASQLERLHSALDDAISARVCRLVTVIGSPGVGKTRLAAEFAHSTNGRARVIVGHCEPSREGTTLLPVAEVFRALAGIGEADPPEIVRTKLGVLAQGAVEAPRITQRIAGVLGIAEPTSAEETFWALRRSLELLARQQPLVIVLDDVHWGQPMFLDLIEHLIEWSQDAPILILALARGELREIREALTSAGRRAREVIELSPLDEHGSRALVTELLGGQQLPETLSERILKRSEGNPLFLGEMVRMLVDDGALRREDEAWVAAADAAAIEVPPTIHALLAARIEQLGPSERAVVERAAVIGKQFYRGAVAQLVSPPVRTEIDTCLEGLRRKDMVEPEGTYWIDEPVYRFHHVLIRDAAYRSLLKEARAELHEQFADWLQAKAGELVGEHEEVIAFHLEQAHEYRRQLGPLDERGRALGLRSAELLHSAGRGALARADLAAAANLLSRALDRRAGVESEILWDLCEAILSLGDTATAAGLVERFASASESDRRGAARTTVLTADLANATGAGAAANRIEAVAEAARELGSLGDRVGEAKAWHVCARAHAQLQQVGDTDAALTRALIVARAAADSRRTMAVLAEAPRAALWGPAPVLEASGRCLDVIRILRMTPGNRHVEAIALRCQAVLEAFRGRGSAARRLIADAGTNLEELGLSVELEQTGIHAALIELVLGDARGAEHLLRGTRDGFASLGLEPGAAQAAALMARALVEQERYDEALEQGSFAEDHGREDLMTMIIAWGARADALAAQGQHDAAVELARHAVTVADRTDALVDRADASMVLARVLRRSGRDAEARGVATTARDLYEAKGHTVGVQSAERAWRIAPRVDAGGAEATIDKAGALPSSRALRPPEQILQEYVARFNAHDLEGVVAIYAEDWVQIDRRRLGWETTRGREPVRRLWQSMFNFHADIRIIVDEVVASDDHMIIWRLRFRGEADPSMGGGQWEMRMGNVVMTEDGHAVSSDRYEYDDDDALWARYYELGGK